MIIARPSNLIVRVLTIAVAVFVSLVVMRYVREDTRRSPFESAVTAAWRAGDLHRVIHEYRARHGHYPDPQNNTWHHQLAADNIYVDDLTDVWLNPIKYDLVDRDSSNGPRVRTWSVGVNRVDDRGAGDDIGWHFNRSGWRRFGWSWLAVNDGYYWARYRRWTWPLWTFGVTVVSVSLVAISPGRRRFPLVGGLLCIAAGGWCMDSGLWGDKFVPSFVTWVHGHAIAVVALSASLSILMTTYIIDPLVRRRRASAGKCVNCAYSLLGISGRCPECGVRIG